MNPWRDKKQICLNGHVITSSYETKAYASKDFCDQCGKRTITNCLKCGYAIPGDLYKNYYLYSGENEPPLHCVSCGKQFPWAKRKQYDILEESPQLWLESLFSSFHSVAIQLQKRHMQRSTIEINDEYDVQDLLHALLKLKFSDIRPEEGTPSFAGKAARMDLLIKKEKVVIETKFTDKLHGEKEIGDELLLDINRYRENPDCKTLFCFIYDKDFVLQNRAGFKSDIESRSSPDLIVSIFISP